MTEESVNQPTIKAKFKKGISFIPGVPKRDLTEEEWDALPEELQKKAVASGVYEVEGYELPAEPEPEQPADEEAAESTELNEETDRDGEE